MTGREEPLRVEHLVSHFSGHGGKVETFVGIKQGGRRKGNSLSEKVKGAGDPVRMSIERWPQTLGHAEEPPREETGKDRSMLGERVSEGTEKK